MNAKEYIQSLTEIHVTRLFEAFTKYDSLLIENQKPEAFNVALDHLNPNGAIFMFQCLPLVHHLVKLGFPVIIHQNFPDLAAFLPVENEPLDQYRINPRDIPKTLDQYLWQWLRWRSDYANSLIIVEPRFWEHIVYNRFHSAQRFLP